MRRTISRGLAAGILASLTIFSPLSAEENVVTIRFEDLTDALDSHPLLLQASDAEAAAEAKLLAASRWDDPVLGLSTGWAESLEGDHRGRSGEIELELDLPLPGRYRNQVTAARAARDAAIRETRALRRELYSDLASRFWEIARDQEWLRRLELSRQALAQLLELTRRRVDIGEARPADLLRFEIEDARLDAEIRAARSESKAKRRNLARQMRLPSGVDFQVESSFEIPGEPLAFEELLARQDRSHPGLEAARLRSESAEAALRAESWGRLPDPSLRLFAARELDAEEVGIGLAFPLPLWNRNGPGLAAAKAEAQSAWHAESLSSLEAAEALETARAGMVAAREVARAMQAEVIPRAKRATEILSRMYEVGEVGVFELVEARRGLMEIELEGLDALLECHLAHLDLQTLTGESCHEIETH